MNFGGMGDRALALAATSSPSPPPCDTKGAKVALITGANRGIGLELAKQLKKRGWHVLGACRTPSKADALKSILGSEKQLLKLDVGSQDSIAAMAKELSGTGIDLLINNAGIMKHGSNNPSCFGDMKDFGQVLMVNAVGAVYVSQALLDNLIKCKGKVIGMSSGLGVIGDNNGGGNVAYRMSKAALGMGMREFCVGKRAKAAGLKMNVVSPGWVQTDMGGSGASITTEQSVKMMLDNVILNAGVKNGAFYSQAGKEWATW